ncbi:hypothetical protein HGA91_03825 [candidate division WWE3 bacterium]|nr:hypothetical protein [candidate division WWE3 bacterium]
MESRNGFGLVEIIILVTLLTAIGVGVWAYVLSGAKSKDGNDVSLTPTQVVTISPSITPKPTVFPTITPIPTIDNSVYEGWNEYKNDELGISFRYLNNWYIPQDESMVKGQYNYYLDDEVRNNFLGGLELDGGKDKTDLVRRPLLLLSVFNNVEGLSVKAWLEKHDINTKKNPDEIPVTLYPRLIAGRQVYFNGTEELYFENNGKIYGIGMGYTTYAIYPEDGFQEIFDKLLDSVELY